jgi:hypothetical protein
MKAWHFETVSAENVSGQIAAAMKFVRGWFSAGNLEGALRQWDYTKRFGSCLPYYYRLPPII